MGNPVKGQSERRQDRGHIWDVQKQDICTPMYLKAGWAISFLDFDPVLSPLWVSVATYGKWVDINTLLSHEREVLRGQVNALRY